MGSSSSKSSSATNYADNRLVMAEGGFGNTGSISAVGGGVSLNLTDGGAVKAAMDASVVKDAMMATNFDNMLKATNEAFTAAAAQNAAALQGASSALSAAASSNSQNVSAVLGTHERGFGNLIDMAETFFVESIGLVDKTISTSGKAFNDAAGVINSAYAAAEAEKSGSLDQRTIVILSLVGAVAIVAYNARKKG